MITYDTRGRQEVICVQNQQQNLLIHLENGGPEAAAKLGCVCAPIGHSTKLQCFFLFFSPQPSRADSFFFSFRFPGEGCLVIELWNLTVEHWITKRPPQAQVCVCVAAFCPTSYCFLGCVGFSTASGSKTCTSYLPSETRTVREQEVTMGLQSIVVLLC